MTSVGDPSSLPVTLRRSASHTHLDSSDAQKTQRPRSRSVGDISDTSSDSDTMVGPFAPLPGLPACLPCGVPEIGTSTHLGDKAKAIFRLVRHEPQYRRNAFAMLTAEAAASLSNTAYLLMMQASASGGEAAAAVMMMDLVRYFATVIAFHQRDNEDLMPSHDDVQTKVAQLSRNIALHGIPETACNIAILAGLAATGLRPENAAATRAVALSMQLGKSYLSTRYFGFWWCLKAYLGDADARAQQRDYNRTIAALEFIVFSLLSRTVGSALYLKLREAFHDSPTDLLAPAIGTITAASALSLAFNANFLLQSWMPSSHEAAQPSSEAQPLLSLGGKLKAFGGLLAHDPDYRHYAACLFACRLGLAFVSGGYLHLMEQAGSSSAVAMIGMAEDLVRNMGYLIAHHERDNEDLDAATHDTQTRRAHLNGRLASVGIPDALGAVAVMAGLAWAVHGGQLGIGTLAMLGGVKVTDTYMRNREWGYWNCLKVYLGNEEMRERQGAINRTINGIENTTLSLLQTVVSISMYTLLDALGSERGNVACIAAVATGVCIATAGRAWFAHQARRDTSVVDVEHHGPADEATPLLLTYEPAS